MLLEGIFLPLTTPFHPDGRIFVRKLETNVERYSRTAASGMLVLGREGEGNALTDAESREVLKAAIGAAAAEKVMIASVGRESVAATLEQAEFAARAGYDAIAVRSPGFAADRSMGAELAMYFNAVADRSPLPLLLLPGAAGVEQVAAASGHAQVIGACVAAGEVKRLLELTAGVSREVTVTQVFAAATGRMLREADAVPAGSLGGVAVLAAARPALKTRMKRVGFQVLAASTAGMLDAWGAGAAGALPALGACAPQGCCEVWQAFKDGDPALAAEKQDRIVAAGEIVEGSRGIAALKHGCDLNAYYGGRPRLPLLPLTAEEREAMERALSGLKN
jgi:dihydrodipicolinate synthase/N-acetylneuraminate lyase